MRASRALTVGTRCGRQGGGKARARRCLVRSLQNTAPSVKDAESAVLAAIQNVKGRGKSGLTDQQLRDLNSAVEVLESVGGVAEPTASTALDGIWRLLYTSRPGTSSPIQRTFVGVDAFSVYQEVDLQGPDPRVNNIVDFGAGVGYLKVEALASTTSRPLPGFTPRRGAGLALLGKSLTYPPARSNMRIDFQFDRAAFTFRALPISIPYPVPFRTLGQLGGELGDETKGWLDITFLSENGSFRLSRGNKGTLFVLQKAAGMSGAQFGGAAAAVAADAAAAALLPPRAATPEALLAAIAAGAPDAQVLAVIGGLANPTPAPARSPQVGGVWRLVWSQQAAGASALQRWGAAQARSYQVVDAEVGTLENVVDLGAVKVRAQATCAASSDERTGVDISGGVVVMGALRVPLPVRGSGSGYVDWLYLDELMRVTRGSKGSVFVHVREPAGTVV